MSEKRGLLLAKMDAPKENESNWNDWYFNTHIKARLALPGVRSARRYTKIEGIPAGTAIPGDAKYLAIYDLDNINVLKNEPYTKLVETEQSRGAKSFEVNIFKLPKFARGVYEQIYPEEREYKVPRSKYVFLVGHEVPQGKAKEFAAWYDTEHFPALLAVPGFVAGRRFIMAEKEIPPITDKGGIVSKYLTIWDIENEHVFDAPEFKKATGSPWTLWVRSWYTRKICMVYKQIFPK